MPRKRCTEKSPSEKNPIGEKPYTRFSPMEKIPKLFFRPWRNVPHPLHAWHNFFRPFLQALHKFQELQFCDLINCQKNDTLGGRTVSGENGIILGHYYLFMRLCTQASKCLQICECVFLGSIDFYSHASSEGYFAAPIFSVRERKNRIRMEPCINFNCRIGYMLTEIAGKHR